MDTLYQLLEWNPVQVGSTFQGGGRGGRGGVESIDLSMIHHMGGGGGGVGH